MFTGIIKKTSKIENVKLEKARMFLDIKNNLGKIKLGDSITVNGVCSTVKLIKLCQSKALAKKECISFEYMPESLRLSNIGLLKKGDVVNLEQSMRLNDRLDGHIVLGHIDGKGKIVSIKREGNSKVFTIKVQNPPSHKTSKGQGNFKKFLVYKGSIAMEGISLTITKVTGENFVVKILPYTLENTNLRFKKVGDAVNLEFDILAKYAYANKK